MPPSGKMVAAEFSGLPIPLVNRQNKLHSKSKTCGHSQQNWIIRFPNLSHPQGPPGFRHPCRRTRREATGQGQLDLRAGTPPPRPTREPHRYSLERMVGQHRSTAKTGRSFVPRIPHKLSNYTLDYMQE